MSPSLPASEEDAAELVRLAAQSLNEAMEKAAMAFGIDIEVDLSPRREIGPGTAYEINVVMTKTQDL